MLNQEEKKIIEYGKKNGKTIQESLQALDKYRSTEQTTPLDKSKTGFLSDVGNDLQSRTMNVSDILESDQNVGSKMLQVAGQGAAFGTDIIGAGIKAVVPDQVKKIGLELLQTDLGKSALKAIGQGVEKYQAFKEEYPEETKNIEAVINIGALLPVVSGARLGVQAGKQIATSGAGALGDITSTAVKIGKKGLSNIGETVSPIAQSASRIPSKIAANIAAKKATEVAIKQLPSKVAQQTVRDGIEIADVKTLVSSVANKSNKPLMKELLNTTKNFASGMSKTNPIEVVGKPIVAGLKKLESLRGIVGKKLGAIANTLGKVTEEEVKPIVFEALKKVPGLSGLKMTMSGVLDFSDTVLATGLSKADRMVIRKIFTEAVSSGTGKQKHLLRQELFEILGGKKGSLQAITSTQEAAFNAIRQGLSTVLENKSAGYKALNQEFAKLIKPLNEMKKLMKATGGSADEDILNMSAGLIARRLTSNAASNPQVRNILRSIDSVLKTSKGTEASVEALQDFYNILNKYYDIAGGTSFQGLVKTGIENTTGLSEEVIKRLKALGGETVAVRQKALERLLSELLK